ncbi:hypothetical protein V6N11_079917 [Hibiscus sabdariffa]|uniref:Uncharacterized protein n=1 Tax=Hibiscus sabdariffa TaxID=183260 RepID=A0ABR2RXB0_9ROSI
MSYVEKVGHTFLSRLLNPNVVLLNVVHNGPFFDSVPQKKDSSSGTSEADSNLHSTDHEPDELTITLPRFFPLFFIVVSPCKSMTFFSYDNTLPLYGLPELNKTGRKTSSGLGMIT